MLKEVSHFRIFELLEPPDRVELESNDIAKRAMCSVSEDCNIYLQ